MKLTVRLSDGELVQLDPDVQEEVYERLWHQAQRGSIMAALKLRDARLSWRDNRLLRLTEQESAAFRQAFGRRRIGDDPQTD